MPGMLYAFDEYLLDTALFELWWRGERRLLPPKPLDLLILLVENRERVVTKIELRDRLWPDVVVSDNALVQTVACTRDALSDARTRPIENVRGRGYRFALPVTERSSTAVPRRGGVVLDAGDDRALEAALQPFLHAGTSVVRVVAGGGLPPLTSPVAPCVLVVEHLERADAALLLLFTTLARAERPGVVVIGTCDFETPDRDVRALLTPLRPVEILSARLGLSNHLGSFAIL